MKTHPTIQEDRWKALQELLLTANYLQRLDQPNEAWSTRRLPLDRLANVSMDNCQIGTHNSRLAECVQAVLESAQSVNLDRFMVCELHKNGQTCFITLLHMNGKIKPFVGQLRSNSVLAESDMLIEELGPDSLNLSWIILLSRAA